MKLPLVARCTGIGRCDDVAMGRLVLVTDEQPDGLQAIDDRRLGAECRDEVQMVSADTKPADRQDRDDHKDIRRRRA